MRHGTVFLLPVELLLEMPGPLARALAGVPLELPEGPWPNWARTDHPTGWHGLIAEGPDHLSWDMAHRQPSQAPTAPSRRLSRRRDRLPAHTQKFVESSAITTGTPTPENDSESAGGGTPGAGVASASPISPESGLGAPLGSSITCCPPPAATPHNLPKTTRPQPITAINRASAKT